MTAGPDVYDVLTSGELTLYGQVRGASNLTLVVDATLGDSSLRCVYKPVRGERALWDFPDGTLAGREVAAHVLDRALGWGLTPPTVLIDRGPDGADLGPGMLQRWIDVPEPDDPARGFDPVDVLPASEVPDGWHVILTFEAADGEPMALAHDDSPRLRRLAVLDVVLNNTDRKGGHVLTGPDGLAYGIDHGICLHRDPKLRTVLWGWAGRPLDEDTTRALASLAARLRDPADPLTEELSSLITAAEVEAAAGRIRDLLDAGVMPSPAGQRALPWPPF